MADLLGASAAAHDPGGRRLPLPKAVEARAVYAGPLDCYRYRLEWAWAPGPALMALLMNPSVAGHLCGDATVCKMHRLATRWGYGRLLVGNAHGYRATDQARLAEVSDPVGPDNERHVLAMAGEADMIVVGYGQPKHRALRRTGPELCRRLIAAGHRLHALRVSADGSAAHPLYLPETLTPFVWEPPNGALALSAERAAKRNAAAD